MILSTSSPRESRLTQVCVSSSKSVIPNTDGHTTPPSTDLAKTSADSTTTPMTAIGRIPVTSTMSWPLLDSYVGKVFLVSINITDTFHFFMNITYFVTNYL